MNKIIIFLAIIFISSCGREAELIKVESILPPISKVSTVLANDLKNRPEMRSSSIVLYPNPQELAGMSFDPVSTNETLEESGWIQVISKLSYQNRIPRGFSADLDNREKVKNTVHIILSISDARDKFFRESGLFQKDLDKKQKKLENLQNEVTTKYICFYPKDSEVGHVCESQAHANDANPLTEVADNCSTLDEWKFNFDEARHAQFRLELDSCLSLVSNYRKFRADIKKSKIGPLNELRKQGKGVVTEMLKQMELYNKQRYLLTAATNEDPANDDTISRLVFNKIGDEVEIFEIYLDSNSGFKMYSLENGGISKLRWYKDEDNVSVLSFSLIDEKFSIEAKLAATITDIFDLRFVGDIVYKEGNISRRGVMKLEFDLASDKN